MYIQLEQNDYDAIAELIADRENANYDSIEYGSLCIEISYSKNIAYHRDTDYHNGTGVYIVDDVEFTLLGVVCDGIDVKYDEKQLINTITDYLWK